MSVADTTKGAPVWLDMDQRALDDAYDQAVWAPNQAQVHERRSVAAAEAYARLKPTRHAYGETPLEAFDFHSCGVAGAPIMIFIHGGAWKGGDSTLFAHLADPFLAAGVHVAVLDFIQIDAAGGHLETMIGQVRNGVAHIARNAALLGGDPSRIFVSGHSSGAHLSGCVLVTDWARAYGLPADLLKGIVLVSGMYELEPVRRSKRSLYVKFTDSTVEKLSAIRHLDMIHCPVIVAYGTQESPEFQRQSREFAAALAAAGKRVELIVGHGCNHFEMVETLHNPYGCVGRAALAMIAAHS